MCGMTTKQYEEETRELGFHFVVAPTIILLGMFLVGTILDAFLGTQNTFKFIFIGVGGIPGVIAYYLKKLKIFGWNNEC